MDERRLADMRVEARRIDQIAVAHVNEFVGMTTTEAEAHAASLGLTIRLMTGGAYTNAYLFGRVSARVVSGRVIEARPG